MSQHNTKRARHLRILTAVSVLGEILLAGTGLWNSPDISNAISAKALYHLRADTYLKRRGNSAGYAWGIPVLADAVFIAKVQLG